MVITVLYNSKGFICIWSYKNKNKYLNPDCSLQVTWSCDVWCTTAPTLALWKEERMQGKENKEEKKKPTPTECKSGGMRVVSTSLEVTHSMKHRPDWNRQSYSVSYNQLYWVLQWMQEKSCPTCRLPGKSCLSSAAVTEFHRLGSFNSRSLFQFWRREVQDQVTSRFGI